MQQPNPSDVYQILQLARSQIVRLAAEVGIDGDAVLADLPMPGLLWAGSAVPVLTRGSRGCCSVLYYVNRAASGQEWPLLRFQTFKNGGEIRTFHGLAWLKHQRDLTMTTFTRTSRVVHKAASENLERARAEQRLARFRQVHQQYMNAQPLTGDTAWLQRRLCGEATQNLAHRVQLKQAATRIFAPLTTSAGVLTGYQVITSTTAGDEKRFIMPHGGLLKGSLVRIHASDADAESAVLICEGIATALSLALVWPGEIRAALCANNLAAVRAGITGAAVFAHDMDIYKTQVGNVGLLAAKNAMRQTDFLLTPRFDMDDADTKPTDFNDVLCLYGLDELYRQSRCKYRPL